MSQTRRWPSSAWLDSLRGGLLNAAGPALPRTRGRSGGRARSSAGEHCLHAAGVAGSIPSAPTIKLHTLGARPRIALRVEAFFTPLADYLGMDYLTTLPLVVGAVASLADSAMQAFAERLLTVVLAIFLIGGLGVFVVTAFAWLWIKRAILDLHARPSTALR